MKFAARTQHLLSEEVWSSGLEHSPEGFSGGSQFSLEEGEFNSFSCDLDSVVSLSVFNNITSDLSGSDDDKRFSLGFVSSSHFRV